MCSIFSNVGVGVTLDKVTLNRKSYTDIVTYYMNEEGKMKTILNEVFPMRSTDGTGSHSKVRLKMKGAVLVHCSHSFPPSFLFLMIIYRFLCEVLMKSMGWSKEQLGKNSYIYVMMVSTRLMSEVM